ncbi:hypothetical protein Mapa_015627 [Marchantia paleacea]|nr:hypothetical protein Mapa_015627 [Marchantia paleacea]
MAPSRVFMAALLVLAILISTASATTYKVGDLTGWVVPETATFFDDWAAKQSFVVGDKLIFTYASGHNVYKVSSTDATACDSKNPLTIYASASPTVTLSTAGTHSFICEVLGHCILGMKMTVDVGTLPKLTNSTAPPAKSLSPAGSPFTSPPAPPPPSSAFSLQSSAAFAFAAASAVAVPWII